MVFLDIGQVNEIDNELILFRELLKMTNSDYYNSLLISQGGRITQHMVEFLVRNKRAIRHNIYESYFEDFLNQCDFIPDNIRKVILEINKYRRDAVYSIKDEYELNKFRLDYFKALKIIFIWFYKYCYEYFGFNRFNEIKQTYKVLNMAINNYQEVNKKNTLIEPDLEEYTSKDNDISEMKSAIFELLYHTKTIDKTTQDINNRTQDIQETTHNIDNKVDQLLDVFKEFYEEYTYDQKRIGKKIDNACSEDEKEKFRKELSDACAKKVKNSVNGKISKTDEYKQEEQELRKTLGEPTWMKLQDNTKTFLTTSKITFKTLNELGDVIDYSGVCLLVTKALEVELTLRFYKRFINYLNKNYKKKYEYYHTSLLNQNPHTKDYYVKKRKHWSLGGIPYLLCFIEHKNPEIHEKNVSALIEYSKDNLFKELDNSTIKETLYEYGSNVYDITKKYRNPAAHTDELQKVNAEECFNYVLDVEQVLKVMLDSFDKE